MSSLKTCTTTFGLRLNTFVQLEKLSCQPMPRAEEASMSLALLTRERECCWGGCCDDQRAAHTGVRGTGVCSVVLTM
jgi:hypothetical protein